MNNSVAKIILFLTLNTFSLYSFTLIEGYKLALENDMDSFVNKTKVKEIGYDQEIAKSLYKPVVNINAAINEGKNSRYDKRDVTSNNYGINIRENIFNGFEAINEHKLQQKRLLSSKYFLQASQNKLAYAYVEAYINVLKNREILALRNESLNISEEIFNKVFKKIMSGYGGKLEFEQAKESYTKSKLDLSIQKINYKTSIEKLKYYVQRDFDSNDLIKPQFYYTLPNSLEEALTLAKENNPDYLVALYNIHVAKYEQKKAQKSNYPSLDLVGSYTKQNSTLSYSDYKVGFELNYNLYNGGKDRATNEKLFETISEKRYILEKTANDLKKKVKLAWNNYTLLKEKLEKQRAYLEAKKALLDATQSEFELGTKTLNNILSEKTAYLSVKGDFISTKYDYLLAQYNILASIGTLSKFMMQSRNNLETQLTTQLEKVQSEDTTTYVMPNGQVVNLDKLFKNKENTQEDNRSIKRLEDEANKVKNKPTELLENKKKITDKNISENVAKYISFKERFLQADPNNYSINLLYCKKEKIAQNILNKYELENDAFYFSFGKANNFYKVMLGIFKTYKDAKEALESLPHALQRNLPRIERIGIKQKLYHKYHGSKMFSQTNNLKDEKSENVISLLKDDEVQEESSNFLNTQKINFKDMFLSASRDKYTINLAFFQNFKNVQRFLDKNHLRANSFAFSFGKDARYFKVVMGVYDNKISAQKALETLPNRLKRLKPRIERVYIKQDLYRKYHAKSIQNQQESEYIYVK